MTDEQVYTEWSVAHCEATLKLGPDKENQGPMIQPA